MTTLNRYSVHSTTEPKAPGAPTVIQIKVVEACDPIAAAMLSEFPLASIVMVRHQDYCPVVAWSYDMVTS